MNSIVNALRGISFFCLVAICKAIADTLADHFDTSIFKKLNPKFWDKKTSSETAIRIPFTKYKIDAWHLTNSFAITFIILSMIYYRPMLPQGFLFMVCEVGIYGILSIVVFNIFYNHILRNK
jgi:hypothetical protein